MLRSSPDRRGSARRRRRVRRSPSRAPNRRSKARRSTGRNGSRQDIGRRAGRSQPGGSPRGASSHRGDRPVSGGAYAPPICAFRPMPDARSAPAASSPTIRGAASAAPAGEPQPMIDFRSDNTGRAAPELIEALARANIGTAPGYGADEWTAALQKRFSDLFETAVRVFPVATGTAANALSLAALSPPWGLVYCSELAHINTSEANAAGFFGGGLKLVPLAGEHGKIAADRLAEKLAEILPGQLHRGQPAAVNLTQATDLGAVYTEDEIGAVAETAKRHGLRLHMDGARFANALARRDRHHVVWRHQERRRLVRCDRRLCARSRRSACDPSASRRPGMVENALCLGAAARLCRKRPLARHGARRKPGGGPYRRRARRASRAGAAGAGRGQRDLPRSRRRDDGCARARRGSVSPARRRAGALCLPLRYEPCRGRRAGRGPAPPPWRPRLILSA